jgi:putative transposase
VKRGYKLRIYPTKSQEEILKKTIGCCRFVYNNALALRRDAFKNGKKMNYAASSRAMTQLCKQLETEWLREVSYVAIQQSLRNLETSFTNFFKKRSRYPKFKKKKNGGSAKFVKTGFRLKDKSFFVAKIKKPIRVVWSFDLPSEPSSCVVSQNLSGQWFVSFVCETSVETLPKTDNRIGIDLGIETFATLSDGLKIKQPDSIRKMRRKVARAQRSHSRKKKGSKNREKARLKVAKIHQKIVNIRIDFLQKLSTQLIRENQTIVIEDLTVSSMLKRGNRKLARLIGEQGWYSFRRMLEYKSEWYGRELAVIDRFAPTSQVCNSCGKINKLTLDKRKFTCECGVTYDRDVNAAQNILAVGTTVSACGADVRLLDTEKRPVLKQEVAELVPG